MFPFERLHVWGKAHAVGVALIRISQTSVVHRGPILTEVVRTACSVCSNIAEGAGSETSAQFARYLGIARASAYELEAQLLLARDGGLIPADVADPLIAEVTQVKRILITLQRRVRAKSSTPVAGA
jgi:four helix bundle protein